MNYYTSIILVTVLLLIFMLGNITCSQNISKRKRKAFICIYLLVLLASVCEWLGVFLDGFSGDINILHKIAKFLELSITPFFPIIYAEAIFSTSKHKTKRHIVIFSLLAFHTTLEFLSMHYGFIFQVDESGYYHHAICYNIYVIAFLLSAFYFFKKLFAFSEYYQNKNIFVLIMIVLFIVIGISIQFVNPNLRTTWLTIGISCILVYIYYNEIALCIDHLTQLLNQRAYKTYLDTISSPVEIILFDVDDFKNVNDTLGHAFGDTVLASIGKAIKEIYSSHGYCYRIGGDEFCVILTKHDCVKKLNHSFVNELNELRRYEPHLPYVSIGHTYFDPDYQDVSEAVSTADQDLYDCKSKLKNERETLKSE